MAAAAFFEAISMADVLADIVATGWELPEVGLSHVSGMQAAKGIGAVAGVVGTAAIPSVIKKFTPGMKQEQRQTQNPMSKRKNPEVFSESVRKRPNMTRAATEGEEVPVMPVPQRVSKTMPDYFNINLPLMTQMVISTTNNGQTVGKARLKMNQLDTIITGNNARARGQSQWTNIFQFYRITQCDVKFTVQPRIASSAKAKDNLYMFGYHLNDTASTTDWTTFRDFGEAKQGGYKLIQPNDTGASFSSCQITYRPENWDLHVQESGIEERWTPVTGAPADPHYLHFGVIGAGAQGATVDCDCIVLVEIIQHVQFREANKSILNTEQTTD